MQDARCGSDHPWRAAARTDCIELMKALAAYSVNQASKGSAAGAETVSRQEEILSSHSDRMGGLFFSEVNETETRESSPLDELKVSLHVWSAGRI